MERKLLQEAVTKGPVRTVWQNRKRLTHSSFKDILVLFLHIIQRTYTDHVEEVRVRGFNCCSRLDLKPCFDCLAK